jgi:hypothetical protein
MKAVIATAQQMAATTTAKSVSRWILNGSRSSIIAWELGQPEFEISVPIAGSLFRSGTCHIGSDGLDILRARLWQFCVTALGAKHAETGHFPAGPRHPRSALQTDQLFGVANVQRACSAFGTPCSDGSERARIIIAPGLMTVFNAENIVSPEGCSAYCRWPFSC